MSELKVGDRVKVGPGYCDNKWLGEEGVIVEIDDKSWPYGVKLDNKGRCQFDAEELELVSD